MRKIRAINKLYKIQWKKKDNIAIFLIIFLGLIFSFIGLSFNQFYDIFFSVCLGLFIGGLLLSIISTFLAQMESNITAAGELDADVDIDVDTDVDIDVDTDVDIDVDADVDIDVDVDADVDIDVDVDTDVDIDLISTITPAPIMLLFSSAFLIFGISGLLLFQLIVGTLRFIILFIAPSAAYLTTKFINFAWKIIAKSRFYRISSTQNLIGIQGEVVLDVDDRGGVIKIPSSTPMRFERIHVKPVFETSQFERGDKVYICNVKNGVLLVDNKKKSVKRRS